jgi:ethanolamine utilization protein EutQ
VSPSAWSKARELGVAIEQDAAFVDEKASATDRMQRIVDASGVVLVRGASVELAQFAGAGGKNVGLRDVITGAHKAPMAAGFMAWSRADSFPWHLTYDEIDLVLEGVLEIHVDGRVVTGRVGDVLYLPKGSRIVFGTPSSVRLFYVTYPAQWA